jgi:ABC-type transport system involved in multi-copper enzyme maturation permease subunit
MLFAALIYGSVFIAIGLLCSALLRRSSAALVLSLLLWTLGVIILPIAAQSAAEAMVPVPSPTEIGNLEKATWEEARAYWDKLLERFPALRGGYDTRSFRLGQGYLKFDGSERQFRHSEEYARLIEPYMQKRADRIWIARIEHDVVKQRQAELVDRFSLPAPIHHLRRACITLAGTSFRNYDNFMESVQRYRRGLITEFQRKGYFTNNALAFFTRRPREEIDDELFQQRRLKHREAIRNKDFSRFGPRTWGPLPASETPAFQYSDGNPDFVEASWSIAVLTISAIVLFFFGFTTFLKYDVR